MLVIRLQRVGKKNQASFRIVLQEHSWAPKGKAKELLGFYNPETKEKAFQKERVLYWIQKGAQPSPTVHNLFIDEGIITGAKVKAWQPKKKPASPESGGDSGGEKASESAPAAEAETAEAPAGQEEVKPEALESAKEQERKVDEPKAEASEEPAKEEKTDEQAAETAPAADNVDK